MNFEVVNEQSQELFLFLC